MYMYLYLLYIIILYIIIIYLFLKKKSRGHKSQITSFLIMTISRFWVFLHYKIIWIILFIYLNLSFAKILLFLGSLSSSHFHFFAPHAMPSFNPKPTNKIFHSLSFFFFTKIDWFKSIFDFYFLFLFLNSLIAFHIPNYNSFIFFSNCHLLLHELWNISNFDNFLLSKSLTAYHHYLPLFDGCKGSNIVSANRCHFRTSKVTCKDSTSKPLLWAL